MTRAIAIAVVAAMVAACASAAPTKRRRTKKPRAGPVTAPTPACPDGDLPCACEHRDLRACTSYALALKRGDGVPADEAAGRALMRDTCTAGHPRACTNLGVTFATGEGVAPNPKAAEELFRRACDDDDQLACLYLADFYEQRRVKGRYKHAFVLREQACEAGHGAGCAAAGRMLRDGTIDDRAFSLEHRTEWASELFDKGCKLGDRDACQGAYLLLVDGDDASVADRHRAATRAEDLCAAGHVPSCQSSGYFYELGLGVAPDVARAETLYRDACESGAPGAAGSCSNLAALLSDRGDLLEAALAGVRGCDLGDARGCNTAGLLAVEDFAAWPGLHAAGMVLLRRACQLATVPEERQEYCDDVGRHHE